MTLSLTPFACQFCAHLSGEWSCAAFDAIPVAILKGRNWHRKPIAGDGGVIFSPIEGMEIPDPQ